MWHFDINHSIYSIDMNRRISIVAHEESVPLSRRIVKRKYYTLFEEWYTANSRGDTGDFDHYTFITYQDAEMFIAKLAVSLNSFDQQILMRAAEVFATRITKEYKDTKRQIENNAKQKEKAAKLANARHVYIFDMENNTVKIGIAKNVEERRRQKISDSGMDILRWCYTIPFDVNRAREIERDCHIHFSKVRTHGEFFAVTFDEACTYLQSHTKKTLVICREEKK